MTIAPTLSPHLLQFSRRLNPAAPLHLGRRYDRQGIFLPEAGNTVVCHLQPGSETEAVLHDARARYLAMPEAQNLAFTALSSLHMTLFQGIVETRREPAYWPAGIALDLPVATMTDLMARRLAAFPGAAPFRVRVINAIPTGLIMEGATEADRQALRDWRDAFAAILGYRHPDHDSYHFHITFSYVIDRFADAALPAWQAMLDAVLADIAARAPLLDLRSPAFCAFADMNHFEELLVFDPA